MLHEIQNMFSTCSVHMFYMEKYTHKFHVYDDLLYLEYYTSTINETLNCNGQWHIHVRCQ